MRTLHFPLAIPLLAFASGCYWEVSGTCNICGKEQVVRGTGCSHEAATNDAKSGCAGSFNEIDSTVEGSFDCIFTNSTVSAEHAQSFGTDVVQAYTKEPATEPAAMDSCGTVEPFTMLFSNNRTSYCPGTPVEWKFSISGLFVVVGSGAVAPGEEISLLVDPTGEEHNSDENGDGLYDSQYDFVAQVSCDGTGATASEGFSRDVLPLGCTLHITLNNDNTLSFEIIPKATAQGSPFAKAVNDFLAPLVKPLLAPTAINAATATEKSSSPAKPDLVPKPDPKFSKRAK